MTAPSAHRRSDSFAVDLYRIDGPARGPQPAETRLDAATVARLEAMRRHLAASRPASGNEALRLLRAAFPNAPLAERVKAADEAARGGFRPGT